MNMNRIPMIQQSPCATCSDQDSGRLDMMSIMLMFELIILCKFTKFGLNTW